MLVGHPTAFRKKIECFGLGRSAGSWEGLLSDVGKKLQHAAGWIFCGRVYPERANINIDQISFKARYENTEIKIDFKIEASQIKIRLSGEIQQISPATLKNITQTFSQNILDILGSTLGCGYEVEITTGVDSDQMLVFGVQESALAEEMLRDPAIEFSRLMNVVFSSSDENSFQLRRSLGDLRQAIRFPEDTAFHCFRAVEALTYCFGRNNSKGMDPLCKALNIDRDFILKTLEIPGGAVRHGKMVPMSGEARNLAFRSSAQIIKRYVHLKESKLDQLPEDRFPLLRFSKN